MQCRTEPFCACSFKVATLPLAGLEGIITGTDKVYRLIVSVSLLQRSVAVEIDREWARPIAHGMGPRAVTLSERTRPFVAAP